MLLSMALLVACGCISDVPSDKMPAVHVTPPTRVKSLAEVKALSLDEYDKYIEDLGAEKNYAALEELCRANLGYAITVYVQALDDKRALRVCQRYPVGSYEWEHAFWGLSSHRKEAVIEYVKETCRTKDPWVRECCYSLCLKAGWDDLIESAKQDISNKAPSAHAIGHTLGHAARYYLEYLPEFQKALNQKK
jgi:hypothetical protein